MNWYATHVTAVFWLWWWLHVTAECWVWVVVGCDSGVTTRRWWCCSQVLWLWLWWCCMQYCWSMCDDFACCNNVVTVMVLACSSVQSCRTTVPQHNVGTCNNVGTCVMALHAVVPSHAWWHCNAILLSRNESVMMLPITLMSVAQINRIMCKWWSTHVCFLVLPSKK
jgi:hypothetical protein